MEELVKFIQSNPEARELKRALAVQMVSKGYLYRQIAEILSVSDSFISKWWLVFEADGVIGLQPLLPWELRLFECRATASGNQLVTAEELLESDTIATAYSRHVQHQVQVPTELLRVICALRASVGRKRKNLTQKKTHS